MTMPAITKQLDADFETVLAQLPPALKSEGFGVLTEIDVKKTLREKIDVDFRRYTILGACNPKLAHQALEHDLNVGVLLPCNVTVHDGDDGGTVVSAVDPVAAIGAFGGPEFEALAADVKARLERVLEQLHA